MFGPLTEEELRAGVVAGHYAWGDFVQVQGEVVWQSVARVLNASEEDFQEALPPDWKSIFRWALARLRYNLDHQGLLVGAACLVLGTLSLVLSAWPFIFWLPWFAAAIVAAVALFRQQRKAGSASIFLAVIGIPALFHFFEAKAPAERTGRIAQVQPIPEVKTPVAEATPAPVLPVKAPEPVAEREPAPVAPLPAAPTPVAVSTPAPAGVTAIAPHYGAVPVAPVEVAPAATPAPESMVSAAGRILGAVVPILTEKISPPSLPELPSSPATASAPPAVPVAKDPKAAEAEAESALKATEAGLLQSHNDAFVLVKGLNGSGSGFVCRQGDKTWLFSNIHVVSEIKQPMFTSLTGTTLTVGGAVVAAGPDIARLTLAKSPEHPLEMMTDFEANVRIGDDVVVLGNSGGGGVVTSLRGKVVGIGPDRIEVSSEFIPGNSGSPIVHLKTGKVIGIATYLTRRYEQFGSNGNAAGSVVVRRFGYRLDKVPGWEPVNWAELSAEADMVEQISKLTEDIYDFLDAVRNKKDPSFATDTLRRPAQEWVSKTRARNVSDSDRLNATQSFLNALRFMVQGDVGNAKARIRYTYLQNRLKDEEKIRDRMYRAFDGELAKLSTPLSRHSFR